MVSLFSLGHLRKGSAALLGGLWRLGWYGGRAVRKLQRPTTEQAAELVPLLRIGSTHAGGGGRTTVATEVARAAADKGVRAALLCFDLFRQQPLGGVKRVPPNGAWNKWSDDALLLAQTGLPVFIARNYLNAWRELSQTGEYDLLIADGGLEDPRLDSATTLLLERWGERVNRLSQLLPLGEHRSFSDDHHSEQTVSVALTQSASLQPDHQSSFQSSISPLLDALISGSTLPQKGFVWQMIVDRSPSEGEDEAVLVTGVGDPAGAAALLNEVGWKLLGCRTVRDHSVALVKAVEKELQREKLPVLLSRKDWIKLPERVRSHPRLRPFGFALC